MAHFFKNSSLRQLLSLLWGHTQDWLTGSLSALSSCLA